MVSAASITDDADLIGALAWSHTGIYLAGSVVLGVVVNRRLVRRPAVVTDLVVGAAVAVVAGLVAAVVASSVGLDGRLGDAVAVVSGGVVGGTVYLVGQQLLGATKPTNVASLVRKST